MELSRKICKKCFIEKALTEFSPRKQSADGRRGCCRVCRASQNRDWTASKKSTFEGKEEFLSKKRKHASNRAAKKREYSVAYHQTKKKDSDYVSRRRINTLSYAASKRGSTPKWANKKRIAEYYETARGLSMLLGEFYHVDHIVPLSSKLVCGLHCESNLRILTRSENSAKGNRFWEDMPDNPKETIKELYKGNYHAG